MIIIQSPLRVSFFGGGTDLPNYYREHGGCVVSSTIDKYIFVTVKRRFDDQIRVGYTQTELVDKVDDVQHDLIREALRMTGVSKGVEITTMGDIPSAGSGLGSSSTVTVGVLDALYAYQGELVSPERLADEACRIEIDVLQKPIGIQDQLIAAFGGLRFMEFLPGGEVKIEELDLGVDMLRHLNDNLMLFYTGITRKADTILSEQQLNINQRLEVLSEMKRLAYMAKDELLHGDVDELGHMLHYGWILKKRMASRITTPQIDAMYEAAREAGALGGKITGAGGGGFMLLYCPSQEQDRVRRALSGLRELPFKLERDGVKPIFNFPRTENGADQAQVRGPQSFALRMSPTSNNESAPSPVDLSIHKARVTKMVDYTHTLRDVVAALPFDHIQEVVEILQSARLDRRKIYVMGNGGSASTATHFACDLYKNVQHPEMPSFLAYSLADNLAAFSAYANDEGYENVFRRTLENSLQPDDVVIAISTSGNSDNVVNAVEFARSQGAVTIGFTGFSGGRLGELVDHEIRVKSEIIEQVEDVHLMLEHMMVTSLKAIQSESDAGESAARIGEGSMHVIERDVAGIPQLAGAAIKGNGAALDRRGELFYQLQRDLLEDQPNDVLLSEFLRKTMEYLSAESGSLLFVGEDGGILGGKVCYLGETQDRSSEELSQYARAGLARWVMQHKEPVIVENTANDDRWIQREGEDPARSAVSVPIMRDGRVFGLLSLKRVFTQQFSKEEIMLLAGIGLILTMNGLASIDQATREYQIDDLPWAG